MNRYECDILLNLINNKYTNQKKISELTGYSIGIVNQSINMLMDNGYLDHFYLPTPKAYEYAKNNSPKNAIILAAGQGMRMVPINTTTPKAFLQVGDELLIERIIRQLHDVGIFDITIVVGFMKERFEYLIDDYGVDLVINNNYLLQNNLHTLSLVREKIDNTYIIPCDVWCRSNPFNHVEMYSWYMISDEIDEESSVRINRKLELVLTNEKTAGNKMIGISYISGDICDLVGDLLGEYDSEKKYRNSFWEETLISEGKFITSARLVDKNDFLEINTYEQLREIDEDSQHLKSDAIVIICEALNVDRVEIIDISVLKKGMTNRSFLFSCRDKRYIMRIPGEGTNNLIDRKNEAETYRAISDMDISDKAIYINPENGYKITEYIENARVCDCKNRNDLNICMERLRTFHDMKITVKHEFDIFEKINYYESLWEGKESTYKDYLQVKEKVFLLKKYIDTCKINKCLTHIDAVPDNFLFDEIKGEVKLIDWEYAGMQDPHVDIAMFCIYSLYDRDEIESLIDIYFVNQCNMETRLKIYCYIAACGLLWSNWCEYKLNLGIEFGEYSLRQYRYAKEYYRIFVEEYTKYHNTEWK